MREKLRGGSIRRERTQLTTDADFLNDLNYQVPRTVRFTARYEF